MEMSLLDIAISDPDYGVEASSIMYPRSTNAYPAASSTGTMPAPTGPPIAAIIGPIVAVFFFVFIVVGIYQCTKRSRTSQSKAEWGAAQAARQMQKSSNDGRSAAAREPGISLQPRDGQLPTYEEQMYDSPGTAPVQPPPTYQPRCHGTHGHAAAGAAASMTSSSAAATSGAAAASGGSGGGGGGGGG